MQHKLGTMHTLWYHARYNKAPNLFRVPNLAVYCIERVLSKLVSGSVYKLWCYVVGAMATKTLVL